MSLDRLPCPSRDITLSLECPSKDIGILYGTSFLVVKLISICMESKYFSQFYRDNVEKVYRFIFLKVNSSELAQDLCSETFLKTWKYFNSKNTEIRDVRSFVYRVARNLIVDWYRSKDKNTVSLDNPAVELTAVPPATEKPVDYKLSLQSDVDTVKKAIEKIRPEHGEVVLLHYLNELSIEEIADVYRQSEGTIRVWLHRGLDELREKLAENPRGVIF